MKSFPQTLREVAARAGVSPATASRALNGSDRVRESTRRRVRMAAEALEYAPDVTARGMRTGATQTVGFIANDFSNPLFSAIAVAADSILREEGYVLVVANSFNDSAREMEAITALRQRRVEGLIVSIADERAPRLAEKLEQFRTVVLLDRTIRKGRFSSVICDHAGGMGEAVRHLADLGHSRIALIAGSQAQRASRARVAAFRREHARAIGTLPAPELVRTGELSREAGYEAAISLIAAAQPPTAIVAGNNQVLVGVLSATKDRGLSIPGDVSLVACDDIDLCRLYRPAIDVINRDPARIGESAAGLMLAGLVGGEPAGRTHIPVWFERRQSTVAPTARQRLVRAVSR